MNGLDWVLTGVLILSVMRGIWRGAVSQVFGIMGMLGGFILASHYYQVLALQLSHAFPMLSAPHVISFAALFLLTWLCVGVVGFVIGRLLHKTGLGFLDRLLGGGVGLVKAVVVAIVLISALTFLLSPKSPILCESCLTPQIQKIAQVLVQAAPENVQGLFEQKSRELKRYWLDQDRKEGKSKAPHNMKKEPKNVGA